MVHAKQGSSFGIASTLQVRNFASPSSLVCWHQPPATDANPRTQYGIRHGISANEETYHLLVLAYVNAGDFRR
jgi:hypothetical protein